MQDHSDSELSKHSRSYVIGCNNNVTIKCEITVEIQQTIN